MISHNPSNHLRKRQQILHQSIRYALVATALLFAIISIHYNIYIATETDQRNRQQSINLDLGYASIVSELSNIQSDINFLSKLGDLQGYYDHLDAQTLPIIASTFRLFSQEKRIYGQIRLLDINGYEIIRINNLDGVSIIVQQQQLQNKSNRYYFRDSLSRERNEIYISPFDLNIEHGMIQKPLNPVIRFGTPVFNSSGKKVGVIVLNYMGNRLLNNFRTATGNIADYAMLLNHEGYWLSHPNRDQEWGFMLDQERSFASVNKMEWKKISTSQAGQFETENGLFTFNTVYPALEITGLSKNFDDSEKKPDYYLQPWNLVAHISPRELSNLPKAFIQQNILLYLIIYVIFLFGTHIIARLITSHHLAEIQIEFEKHFRGVLESIELNILAVDLDGNITFCNDSILKLLGWKREQLIGQNWIEKLVVERNKPTCQKLFDNAKAEGRVTSTHESWLKGKIGGEYLIRWHDTSMSDPVGNTVGLIFMGEDITRDRENEVRINLLSEAVEQSPASVIVTNNQGMIEYVNPKFERLTGYQLDEIKGLNPRILKSGHTSNNDYSDLWKMVQQGKTWRGIFHNRKKNGTLYWESASISGIRNPDGKITHFLAVKEDITQQKMLEERFQHCFNAAPVAMIMSDSTGKIIIANDKLQDLFGFSENDLLGQNIQFVIPQDALNSTNSGSDEKFSAIAKSASAPIGDYTATKKSGETFPVQIGRTSTPTHEGDMTISAIIDLSTRQELEKELLSRNEEISRNQAFNTIGKMASMIAHDLRNPLSSIKMGLQIFQKKSGNISHNDASELNQIALEQVYYMEDILDDLMSYSRPDALNLEWVDIEKVIEHSIGIVQKEIDSSQALINTWFEKGLPIINADSRKMRQIISNLLTNAIQSVETMEDVSPVINIVAQLELGDETSYIKVAIQDNGCGIKKDDIDSLFEPFYTSRTRGTGLGLAIAKRFIELQGGIIQLEPSESGGTSAIVKLNIDPVSKQYALSIA